MLNNFRVVLWLIFCSVYSSCTLEKTMAVLCVSKASKSKMKTKIIEIHIASLV